MLPSISGIYFLLLGRLPDVKALQAALKILKAGDWSQADESRMRTMANWQNGKSKPFKSTFKRTNHYFEGLAEIHGTEIRRQGFSKFAYEDLFKPEVEIGAGDKWTIMQAQYEETLAAFGLSDFFVTRELQTVLAELKSVTDHAIESGSESVLDKVPVFNGILSFDGMIDGLLVSINVPYMDPIHGQRSLTFSFNLNLMLYLQACLEVEEEKIDENCADPKSVIQNFFDDFMKAPALDKPVAHHYVEMLKKLKTYKDGKDATWSDVIEFLGISEEKTLSRYRTGESPHFNERIMAKVIEKGGLLYASIAFWVNLMKLLTDQGIEPERIYRELRRYPDYLGIAKKRRSG